VLDDAGLLEKITDRLAQSVLGLMVAQTHGEAASSSHVSRSEA
jgi:hypothetical protein